jgi:hypothetical protein
MMIFFKKNNVKVVITIHDFGYNLKNKNEDGG